MDIKVVGLDPSLCNFGIAVAQYKNKTIHMDSVHVIQPAIPTGKSIRVNTKDLYRAHQLFEGVYPIVKNANAVFVEVPVGSQTSRAQTSYGICVGILASLRALDIPIYEVTPIEVKMASVGNKTASKEAMIAWATSNYPNINWPIDKRSKDITASKAEHMSDAIAAIHAGVNLNEFQKALALFTRICN